MLEASRKDCRTFFDHSPRKYLYLCPNFMDRSTPTVLISSCRIDNVYDVAAFLDGIPQVEQGTNGLVCFIYTIYWIYDIETPYRGGRPKSWFRNLPLWRLASEYFQACLVVSDELREWIKENEQDGSKTGEPILLPSSHNYLLGYHPHGFCAIGALLAYGSESLKFSKIFPGIKPYLATLNLVFRFPFFREYALSFGGVSANRESLEYLLDKDTTGTSGNLVAVALGGVREMIETRPGQYTLVLSRRRGFFQLALRTGAYLVPSINFGETNTFDQVANPEGSIIRKVQDWFMRKSTMSYPAYYAPFCIPYRQPITVVVGRPITCQRSPNPTDEDVNKVKEEYKNHLVQLFNKYRPLYDPTADDIRFI
ncbi:hypothetical protein Aperf_G00000132027 [Anoplocephala perfoliata]